MDRERIPGIHAEMHCLKVIQHMDINFSKVKLYIYRIRKINLMDYLVHVHPVWLLSGILEYSTYTTQQIMATFTNVLNNQWRITRYIIKKRM